MYSIMAFARFYSICAPQERNISDAIAYILIINLYKSAAYLAS